MTTKKQTAAEAYVDRRHEVDVLLDQLAQETQMHAEYTLKEPRRWDTVGDLAHLRDLLVEALAFLAQRDEDDIREALRESLDETND